MSVKALCFHLPQYHPIPENDEWWGRGFTEWRKVVKAQPAFRGHYQPHLPADLGFYDLRLAEARQAQADLARQYGIHGFIYYHYWFNGRRVLERPVNDILSSGEPDFPFCLCWANENWTRRWDGQDQEVLLHQEYGDEDDLAHIRWLATVFKDSRYIRVDGRPLFLVYRLSNLPDPAKTVALWRAEARKLGVGELFLCNVESFGSEHGLASRFGLDAAIEFAPDWQALPPRQPADFLTRILGNRPRALGVAARLGLADPGIAKHRVHSYGGLVKNMLAKPEVPYLRFPGVTPSWDNTARRKVGATIFQGSSPQVYQGWLEAAARKAQATNPSDPIVVINAWNEWAEGNHLEPCEKWGHAYLEATRDALLAASR